MAVRIRLLRMGKIRNPQYRIVVADSRVKRDGKAIENIGIYHPKEHPSRIEVNSERVQYWLSVGAQPSEPVQAILRKTGDWQKFKGEPPPEQPLLVAAPKVDRQAIYEAEAKAAAGLAEQPGKGEATTAAKKSAKKGAKKAEPKAEGGESASAEASTETAGAEPAEKAEASAKAAEADSGEQG
ncbi:30S ribosomal protein S16 [Natronosporangium hydrolyticum]|uniref:Small ribosomal subunit protein bS16 n=1 Tax=Natronosporangium hydrolyticum TaxID=2811111 RepID=A0A895YDP7_9ACTN|nr:30S ribosomal protein S16 [Natronosporangium hydrolyticum]QSB13519.1 30S ribosomal protein S16 [Natronosporangium hydrolyticum]